MANQRFSLKQSFTGDRSAIGVLILDKIILNYKSFDKIWGLIGVTAKNSNSRSRWISALTHANKLRLTVLKVYFDHPLRARVVNRDARRRRQNSSIPQSNTDRIEWQVWKVRHIASNFLGDRFEGSGFVDREGEGEGRLVGARFGTFRWNIDASSIHVIYIGRGRIYSVSADAFSS